MALSPIPLASFIQLGCTALCTLVTLFLLLLKPFVWQDAAPPNAPAAALHAVVLLKVHEPSPRSLSSVLFDSHPLQKFVLPVLLSQCGVYTRKFLDAAVRLVKPGGRLVFSTCTLNPCKCCR